MGTLHAFDYLSAPEKHAPSGVCVVFGDEPFLKRLVLGRLREAVLGGADSDVPFTSFEGGTAEWRDVLDELSTVSLFGEGARLVVIEDADEFVTDKRSTEDSQPKVGRGAENRGHLESYVERPRSTGVLILEASRWATNTRLYKAITKTGLQIECRAPMTGRGSWKKPDDVAMLKWLAGWSRAEHDATIGGQAAELMYELVGPEFGLLDQELAKLALFAGPGGDISTEMVRDVVGGWRTKTT